MRKFAMGLLLFLCLSCVLTQGCEQSDGMKSGVLQKVSHKTFPVNYYVAEFAYEGGVGDEKTYENRQEVSINSEAYDTLQNHVGEKVRFSYGDNGLSAFAPSKVLTSISTIK